MKLFNLDAEEVWFDLKGYEGFYKISKDGEILKLPTKVKTKAGYVTTTKSKLMKITSGRVELSIHGSRKTELVRNLLAATFFKDYVQGQPVFYISGSEDNVNNLSLVPIQPLNQDNEEWKDIPGYEGYYQASKSGQIRSVTRCAVTASYSYAKNGKILKQHLGSDGYLHCMLSKDGTSKLHSVHRLLASTFIPNDDNKPQVNHINGVKTDNTIENLEWVTRSENMQHAKSAGLWDPKCCGCKSKELTGIPVTCISDNIKFSSISEAAKFYDMDFESVKESILLNRTRKGKLFKYTKEGE